MNNYELRHVREHIEVFQHGRFLFSADTEEEARRDIREQEERNIPWGTVRYDLLFPQ